ncbi:MAG TPA: PKD domain-containing protein [Bacteroidia bacterium]|nr:PKD domain-containing protein [Bacteroidia bacterium]
MKHFLLLALALTLYVTAHATHVVGGSLTYEHLGGSTYRVTLKMYRDCAPGNAAFPSPVVIEVRDVNGNVFTPNKQISIPFPGATAVQPYIDTCAANPGLCLEEAIYTRVVNNLPPQPGGYHLYYQYCCRNSTLDNVVNPLNTGESWYAFIPNNAALITNSSPVWTNPPPVFVCQGNPMNYDHGATDSDGDSLVYSYYTPYSDPAPTFPGGVATFTPITWIGGFGPNNAAGGPNLTMSSSTGYITGAPPFTGQYVCGVRCEEFRNGVKIGEILRDFQLNVVYCPPIAQASIGPSNDVCTGGTINFVNTSDPANSYYWDFGDGASILDTSTFQSPTYTYPGLGPYLVTLIINYGTPCADTGYQTIDISSVSTNTAISGDSACVGQSLTFTDSSTVSGNATLSAFWWEFGNGDTANTAVVTYTWSASGTYTVTHVAVNSLGCNDTAYTTVYIVAPPIALAGNDTFACTNNSIIGLGGNILNASSGFWTGQGSFNPGPTTYNATYTPTQTELDSGYAILILQTSGYTLCSHDFDTVRIDFLAGPVVDVGQDLFVCRDTPYVSICGTVSVASGGVWSTSGSGGFTNPNLLCTDYTPSAADTAAGVVMLWMTSTGNGSCNPETDTLFLYLTPPPNVQAIAPDTACSNVPFQLTANTATGAGIWTTTGDGSFIGGDTSLITMYMPGAGDLASGTITIVFNSLNNGGCQQQRDTVYVTVIPAPSSGLQYTSACPGYAVQFADQTQSVTAVVSWSWDFGDPSSSNNTSTAQNPSHIYGTGGWYNVTLITMSANGCPDTVVTPVYVYPNPIPAFTTSGYCSNEPILFTDASTVDSGGVVTWLWQFGDNTTDNGQVVTHIFPNASTWNVSLIVTTNFGCVDTITQPILIYPAPNAAFTSNPLTAANTFQTVQFTDQSTIANTIVGWEWNFGDSTNSFLQNPSHAWTSPGLYPIVLIVTDTNGCMDTTVVDYIISSPPVVPSGFSPNGDGQNDIFYVLGGPFTELELRIYNKWGELIFVSTSQAIGWDGTRDGIPQPVGVYVYTVHAVTPDSTEHFLEGDVTLVR